MYWVCVGIQPQTQISIPYETTTATLELPPYVSWTPTPTPTDPPGFTPTPTPGALPANCRAYYQAKAGDTCQAILSTYTFVSEAQFLSWHPSLNGNCAGLLPGYWYCAAAFDWADLPMPPTVTTPPTPAQTGTAADCTAWYFATGDDCAFIASIFGTFSPAQFIAWNPSVQSHCSGIKPYTYYCVAVPGTPTTRTAAVAEPTTTTAAAPTGRPTQAGIAADCAAYWFVSTLDTCASIAELNGISQADLVAWNPALGSDCGGLVADFDVCVGLTPSTLTTSEGSGASTSPSSTTTDAPTSSSPPPSTTTAPPPTSTTGGGSGGVVTPSPIQDGMVSGCQQFYLVQSGDGCWAIANAHSIALPDFYAWNPAVNNGGECWGLWPDVYVCVGL